jgi:hypothetical protein
MFWNEFQKRIMRPVQPHEASIEYLPTQAVAEYLDSVAQLDGVIYPSAQVRPSMGGSEFSETNGQLESCNLVLFPKASRVEVAGDKGDSREPTLEVESHSVRAVRVKSVQIDYAAC